MRTWKLFVAVLMGCSFSFAGTFHIEVEFRGIESVKKFLRDHPKQDIEALDNEGYTALMRAAQKFNTKMMQFLLDEVGVSLSTKAGAGAFIMNIPVKGKSIIETYEAGHGIKNESIKAAAMTILSFLRQWVENNPEKLSPKIVTPEDLRTLTSLVPVDKK
jgi:ankyrin repeat protein